MQRRRFLLAAPAAPAAWARQSAFQRIPEIPAAAPARDAGPWAGRRWRAVWRCGEDSPEAAVADFVAPAPGRACAVLQLDGRLRRRHFAAVTRNGGASWTGVPLQDKPVALCATGASSLWLLGEKALWYSVSEGLEWVEKTLPNFPKNRPLFRVFFLDDQRGWAFGAGKTFYATADGAASWQPVPESAAIALREENIHWTSMVFPDARRGLIAGFSSPRRGSAAPPEGAGGENVRPRRLRPSTTIAGETRDGGRSWRFSCTSAFGRVVRLRAAGDHGLAISHYGSDFEFPAEAFLIDFRSGGSRPVFRRRGVELHDAAVLADGSAVLAAIEPAGEPRSSPAPGRLCIFHSPDCAQWFEMRVDDRAEGRRAFLAAPGPDELWAATDSGCILRLA